MRINARVVGRIDQKCASCSVEYGSRAGVLCDAHNLLYDFEPVIIDGEQLYDMMAARVSAGPDP